MLNESKLFILLLFYIFIDPYVFPVRSINVRTIYD